MLRPARGTSRYNTDRTIELIGDRKRAANRGQDPVFRISTASSIEGRIERDRQVQAAQQERARIRNLPPPPTTSPSPPPDPPTPPAPIMPVSLTSKLFGLPIGLLLHPTIHDELQAIALAAQSAFQQVNLDGWCMDESLADSVRLRSKAKWGDESVNASTFLHLDRLDIQKLLRDDPDGFVRIVSYGNGWETLHTQLFTLQARLGVILIGWMLHEGARGDISELPGYVSPTYLRALLSVAIYQISTMSAFVSGPF